MPLKAEAKLLHRSVFFTGETVHCQVSFTHVGPSDEGSSLTAESKAWMFDNHKANSGLNSAVEDLTIAWASAQIYCQCHLNESRVVSMNNVQEKHSFPADMTTSFIPTRGKVSLHSNCESFSKQEKKFFDYQAMVQLNFSINFLASNSTQFLGFWHAFATSFSR